MDKYIIKDGIIVRTDTGKRFLTMISIVEQINYYGRTNRYTVMKDRQGNEYIEWIGFNAKYYDLEEICELMNAIYNGDLDKKYEKHLTNTHNRIGHYTRPYFDGRYYLDSTMRKGFWLEDWITGRTYYFHIRQHIEAIVGLLNDYTKEGRFTTDYKFIYDNWINEKYFLGDSKALCYIRDFLNNHDYLKYGERKELPHRRQLM